MTIGIDTSRLHIETYKEYSKHEESWYSYEHFLLVKIMRLEAQLKEVAEEMDDIDDMMWMRSIDERLR